MSFSHKFRRGLITLFLNLGRRLTMAIAKVVKPGFHNLRDALYLNFFDIGRVDREGTLDAFAE